MGTVVAKKVLIDFRYSAKQNFSHGALKFDRHIFLNKYRINMNEVSLCMFSDIRNQMPPPICRYNAFKFIL